MIDQDDLVWLAERRPEAPEPDPLFTDRLRGELAAAPSRGGHGRGRGSLLRRFAVLVGVAAIGAGAFVVAGRSVPGPASTTGAAPEAAAPGPLARLAREVASIPEPPGDATLVERRHAFPDDRRFGGYDLFTDDGDYFFGETLGQLRVVMGTPGASDRSFGPVLRAAAAAATLPPDQARAKLYAARPLPDGGRLAPSALAAREELIERKGGKVTPPASLRTRQDNALWMSAMDAITAGAGRADMRAGAMSALSTIRAVHVERTTFGGRDVLAVTNTDFGDGYRETLYLDARTGVLVHFRGGTAGHEDVDVSYAIRRVDASTLKAAS